MSKYLYLIVKYHKQSFSVNSLLKSCNMPVISFTNYDHMKNRFVA